MEILVFDECGSDDFVLLFSGSKEELILAWDKKLLPRTSKKAAEDPFWKWLILKDENFDVYFQWLTESGEEADALIKINDHDQEGDHRDVLVVRFGKERIIHERAVT